MDTVNREGIYDGSKPYVFISYSHKDTKIMMQVKEFLDSNGIRFWYDYGLHSGADWYKSIAVHLKNSASCIVLLSPNSVESEYVKNELHYANINKVPVHILMLEKFDLPEDVDMMTGRIQRTNIEKDYKSKLLRSLPKEVFKETPPPQPKNFWGRSKKLLQSMSDDIVNGDEINPKNPVWRFLRAILRVFRKIAKFFGIFLLVYFIFIVGIAALSNFFGWGEEEPVTAPEVPCFADFAGLEPCIKKTEDNEKIYESYILKSTTGNHDYPVVEEYINYITTNYSFKKLGEKTYDIATYTEWHWFEFTGDDKDKITARNASLSYDNTQMGEYHLSILVHEQESGVIVRVFTAPEIKEVESKKTFN